MPTSYTFKDLDLNFGILPSTGDIDTVTDATAVKRSLRSLILTRFYERHFHPEKGSIIPQLLFDNWEPSMDFDIARGIENVAQNFEPRVQIEEVVVKSDLDRNGLYISIRFYMQNSTELFEVDMFLEKLR